MKNKKVALFTVTAISVFAIFAVIIGMFFVKNRQTETAVETGVATPVPVTVKFDYEELFISRDEDETQIEVKVSEYDSPALRTEPEVADDNFVGRLPKGRRFTVSKAYAMRTGSGIEWYGFPEGEAFIKGGASQEKAFKDQDKILWVNAKYVDVKLDDHDPGESDDGNTKYYTRYEGNVEVFLSECALRSSDKTTNSLNIYGRFGPYDSVKTSILYENSTNTFYGVPVSAINASRLQDRMGNPESDPDGIVWFSTDYVTNVVVE